MKGIGKLHRNHLVIYISKNESNSHAVLSHAVAVSKALSKLNNRTSHFKVPLTCRKA